MSKKFGISLASVMIATLLIILLTTTITISINKVLENADKISFASEISSIQKSVTSYYMVNKEYPILSDSIIMDITSIKEKDIFYNEEIIDNKIILNKIDYNKISYVSLKYGNNLDESDLYGISLVTGKVYYVKGIKFENKIYYTLNDELNNFLLDNNSNIKNNEPIIIIPSTIEWSNSNISVVVKVPKNYSNISVISGIDSYSLNKEEDNYYVYYIEKEGNYTVEVKAKDKDGKIKEATYRVENFDIEKPSINIDNHIILSEEYNSEIFGYYNIISVYDNLSGIGKIKYEYGRINDNIYNYFKTNGETVKDNKILVKRGYEYVTVYIEDNAKNYDFLYVKI